MIGIWLKNISEVDKIFLGVMQQEMTSYTVVQYNHSIYITLYTYVI